MAPHCLIVALAGLMMAATSSAAENLVSNPSWEGSSNLGPWTCASFDSQVQNCGVNVGSGANGFLASQGSNNVYMAPGMYVSQSLKTKAGAIYRLSFDAYANNEWWQDPAMRPNLQISFRPQALPPAWNAADPSSYYVTAQYGDASGPYASYWFNVTAGGNDVLTFAYTASAVRTTEGDATLRLDNVQLIWLEDGPKPSHKLTAAIIAGYALIGAATLCALGWALILWFKLRSARKRLRARTLEVMNTAGEKSSRFSAGGILPSFNSSNERRAPPPPVAHRTASMVSSPPPVPVATRPTPPNRPSSQVTSPRAIPPPVPSTRPGQKPNGVV